MTQFADLERCGCPEEWLAEYPSETRDRRITGCQVSGDHHLTLEGRTHLWNGERWLSTALIDGPGEAR